MSVWHNLMASTANSIPKIPLGPTLFQAIHGTWAAAYYNVDYPTNTVTNDTGTATDAFFASAFPACGMSYWEVKILVSGVTQDSATGVTRATNVPDDFEAAGDGIFYPDGVGMVADGILSGNGFSYGTLGLGTWAANDVIMFAYDASLGRIFIGKNGTWHKNPATEFATPSRTVTGIGYQYYITGCPARLNDSMTLRVQDTEFEYTVPEGFLPAYDAYVNTLPPTMGTGDGDTTDEWWDEVRMLAAWEGTVGTKPTPELGPLSIPLAYLGADCAISDTVALAGSTSLFVDVGDHIAYSGSLLGQIYGDFTVETLVQFNTLVNYDAIVGDYWHQTIAPMSWALMRNGTKFSFATRMGIYYGTFINGLIGTSDIVIDTPYHVAVCRSGDVTRLFVNGIEEASVSNTRGITLNYQKVTSYIGRDQQGNTMTGYIDELRITAAARYTANFTPPTVHPRTGG